MCGDRTQMARGQAVNLLLAGSIPVGRPNNMMAEAPGAGWSPKPAVAGSTPASAATESCPACGSGELAKIKGCVRCLRCGYKADCNGWG
jgi:hypothetical protein